MNKIYTAKEVGLLLHKSSQQIRRYTKAENGAEPLLKPVDEDSTTIHITRDAIITFLEKQLGDNVSKEEIEKALQESEEKLENGLLLDTKAEDVKRKKEIYRFIPRISKGNAKKALRKIFGHRSHKEDPSKETPKPLGLIPANDKLNTIFFSTEDKYMFIKGLRTLLESSINLNPATYYFLQDRANVLGISDEAFQDLIDDEPPENIRFDQRLQVRAFITEAIYMADFNLGQKESIYSNLQKIANNHMLGDKFEEYKTAAEKTLEENDELY